MIKYLKYMKNINKFLKSKDTIIENDLKMFKFKNFKDTI